MTPIEQTQRMTVLEQLSEPECYRLLELHRLGRIAITVGERPEIFPVNYALRGRLIAFRTAPGTKLVPSPMWPIAFEVDEFDAAIGVGWSVVVHGMAQDVTAKEHATAQAVKGLSIRPRAPGDKTHVVAIQPLEVTGRRFRLHG